MINVAVTYYTAMGAKDLEGVGACLHPDVEFIGPLGTKCGKSAVLEAVQKFIDLLEALTIRAQFKSGNQAMVAYDVLFPEPIGNCRSAALMTIQDGLITKIELFFDARSFG